MMMTSLSSKMLKFRLPLWRNKKYWEWQSANRIDGYEWHHLLPRAITDLFVVNIPKEVHDRIHHGTGYEDGEWETMFIESITNITKFIDWSTNNG
jgi:hypothetical protein